MNKSKIQRSPLSPRLRPPKSPQMQSKIEKASETFLSLAGKNLTSINNLPAYQTGSKPLLYSSPIPSYLPKPSVSSPNLLYLDLEDNQLKSESLQAISQSIITLNLTNNPLLNCAFPSFKNLRTLSIDNCGLESFDGFPHLPHLCYLSATNNKFQSFKGFRILPELESINLSNNPVDFPLKLVYAAVGSLNLKEINSQEVTSELIKSAFDLSPLVAFSLRQGRPLGEYASYQEELNAAQSFLTKDLVEYSKFETTPKLSIKQIKGSYYLTLPFKCNDITWFKSQAPNDKGKDWIPISPPDAKNPDIFPVSMPIRLHLVKCEFTLKDKIFTVYTDDLVGREPKDLAMPYPIDPIIAGTPVEGSLITILPFPYNARVAWIKDGEVLAEETDSIILTANEIGKSVACVLQPYSPLDKTLSFTAIFIPTGTIAALKPIVTGITFPESILEGQLLTFDKKMNPDREGDSKITIERSISQYGEWIVVAELSKDNLTYTPNCYDVGKYLRITYCPITTEGTTGEIYYFYSKCKVLPTMPTFKNPVIGGVNKTWHPLIALADYSGGIKGNCKYEWYCSKRPIDVKRGLKGSNLMRLPGDTQLIIPDQKYTDCYIAVLMIPVRIDEVVGEPKFVATDTPLLLEDEPKPMDNMPSEVFVGKTIHFPTPVEIYLSKPTGFCGFDLLKTGQTYTPRDKHLGRFVRIVTENHDSILGEIKPAKPVIVSVDLVKDRCCQGETISIDVHAKHVITDKVEIIWIRCIQNKEMPVSIGQLEYVIQPADIGFRLKAAVIPYDFYGKRLEPTYSDLSPIVTDRDLIQPEIIGPLIEDNDLSLQCQHTIERVKWYRVQGTKLILVGQSENYTLTIKDVGYFIKAKVFVTVPDGTTQKAWACSNEPVKPALPTVSVSIDKEIVEGQTIIPEITYHGGYEGKSTVTWHRENDDGMKDIVSGLASQYLKYTVTSDDIDCILQLTYTPIRNDGTIGDQVTIECGPVEPANPEVSNVVIKQSKKKSNDGSEPTGLIEVEGKYNGSAEGQSFIIWRVYDENGAPQNLGKTIEKFYIQTRELVGKTVDAIYVPVRFDGSAGQPVQSNKIVVKPLPQVLSAEILVKGGQLISGALMRCVATFSPNAYGIYQWSRGDGTSWELIDDATDAEITLTDKDVGYYLKCEVKGRYEFGWFSEPFDAVTNSHIRQAKFRPEILNGTRQLITGQILKPKYCEHMPESIRIKWQRNNLNENPGWKTVTHDREYILTENDVGYIFRFVTQDGKCSDPTKFSVKLDDHVASYANSIVRSKQFSFSAKSETEMGSQTFDAAEWKIKLDANNIYMSTKGGIKKSAKLKSISVDSVLGTVCKMTLLLDPSSKFTLTPQFANEKRKLKIIDNNVRDFVVTVIRGFISKSQNTV